MSAEAADREAGSRPNRVAARRQGLGYVLLLIQTVGILDILYLIIFSKRNDQNVTTV